MTSLFSKRASQLIRGLNTRTISLWPEWSELCIHSDTIKKNLLMLGIGKAALKKKKTLSTSIGTELRNSFLQNKNLNIYFINDNGVYAGAGIATGRQSKAFAQNGHKVTIIPLTQSDEVNRCIESFKSSIQKNPKHKSISFCLPDGNYCIDPHGRKNYTDFILNNINTSPKDSIIIIGNLHSDKISPRFLFKLLADGFIVIFYCHDLDFATGGCAYPQYHSCDRYLSCCADTTCPKPIEDYPQSSASLISFNYVERELLTLHPNFHLFTNSEWTKSIFKERYPFKSAFVSLLGVDKEIFKPDATSKQSFCSKYGISSDSLLIVVGADSLSRKGKGGEIIELLLDKLKSDADIIFCSIGHCNISSTNLISCGYLDSEHDIAKIYQAADLFVNPASIEAFGQTAIESSMCGCPVLYFKGTGLDDAVTDLKSGLAVKDINDLVAKIMTLKNNKHLLSLMQEEAAEWSLHHFTLNHSYYGFLEPLIHTTSSFN